MNRCPFCGAELNGDASFCPYCMKSLIQKTVMTPPRRLRRSVVAALLLVAFAIASLVTVFLMQPPPSRSSGGASVSTTRSATMHGLAATTATTTSEPLAPPTSTLPTDTTTPTATDTTVSADQSGDNTTSTVENTSTTTTTLATDMPTSATKTTAASMTTTTKTPASATTRRSTTAATTTTSKTAAATTTTTSKVTTTTTETSSSVYYTIANGEVTITGTSLESGVLNIPSTIEGCPVTAIGADAFKEKNLQVVTIPESVTSIGARAFYDCNGLYEITIPKNVTHIGRSAFYYCDNMKVVYFNALNCGDCLAAFENIWVECFMFAPGIKRLPESLIYDSPGVNTFYIPKSVTYIPRVNSGDLATYCVYYEGSEADRQSIEIAPSSEFARKDDFWFYNSNYESCKPNY